MKSDLAYSIEGLVDECGLERAGEADIVQESVLIELTISLYTIIHLAGHDLGEFEDAVQAEVNRRLREIHESN